MSARFYLQFLASGHLLAAGIFCLCQAPDALERSLETESVAPQRVPLGQPYVVALDAGHGGKDSGTSGHRLVEKVLTLDLTKRVAKHLRELGVTVVLTRSEDVYVPLEERCAMTRRASANLFVSIHLNASVSADVAGLETYHSSHRHPGELTPLHPSAEASARGRDKPEASLALAQMVQRFVCRTAGIEDRGVRDSGFYVLMHTPCPAVLVECGYVTNEAEAHRLETEPCKEQMAGAIAEAVWHDLLVMEFHHRRSLVAEQKHGTVIVPAQP